MTLKKMKHLAQRFINKEFRQSYMESETKQFVASQIRYMRGEASQKVFAKKLGTTQSVISRLENSEYGKVSLTTLLNIAMKLDIALIVRFVDYCNFINMTNDLSESALRPKAFDKNDFITGMELKYGSFIETNTKSSSIMPFFDTQENTKSIPLHEIKIRNAG